MNKDQIMLQAAYLAKQGKGKTAPNPCVGAVIVKDGQIVARGWHKAYGQAHAEVEAITEARNKGVDLKNTSLFVTLEPCNHYGKTPPCTRAILEAGIKKVFVGARDPNPHVQGGGIEFLRANGVRVEAGILEEECWDLIADFIAWTQEKRPYSYLKIASTLDGKIATYNGHSKWITSPKAREEVHRLRSQVGAVIVGGNTFYADNPKLTCRLEGDELTQPLAVIVTSRLPEADDSFYLLSERAAQTVFWTTEEKASSSQAERLRSLGCQVWGLPLEDEKLGREEHRETQSVELQRRGFDLWSGFERLFQEYKIYYTLCEGGGRLALSLLEQNLVDELCLFLAPKILGDHTATSSFSGRKVASMDEAINFRLTDLSRIGPDIFLRLMKNRDN